MDLPNVAAWLALSDADRGAVLEAAIPRTYWESKADESPAVRREWFAAWREFLHRIEEQEPRFTLANYVIRAALDILEAELAQHDAGRN